MRRLFAGSFLFVLTVSAGPALAQNPGLPVVNSGVSSGLTLAADVGFPSDDAGGGTAFGGTGKVGLGPLGLSATISSYKPDGGESHTSVGGTVNWKVFGGPLIPFAVTLQAGAAHTSLGGVTMWHFPVGLGLSAKIPTTVVGIKPWIAPRLDVTRVSNGTSHTESDFGFSAGVEISMLSGLGFHAAYDRVSADGGSPSVFAIGVHYGLNLPGLP